MPYSTLEIILQDRIICGINNTVIQYRLISEKGLLFKSALELAQGMELTTKNVRELNVPVHDLQSTTGPATIYSAGQNPVN